MGKSDAVWRASLVLVALAAGATLLNLWLDHLVSVAGLTLVYLLAVVIAAAVLPRWAGLLVCLVCVSALNFFFIPPRHSFQVDSPDYLLTLAILLGLSLAVHALIANLRARGAVARDQRDQAQALHALSEHLAAVQGGAQALALAAAQWMQAHVQRPCAVVLRPPSAGVAGTTSSAGLASLGPWFAAGAPAEAFHQRAAVWALDNRRPLGRGCPDWSDLPLWCAPFQPRAPSGSVQLLLPARAVAPDDTTRAHWLALVRQIGLCVEREQAAELARTATDAQRGEAMRNAVLAGLSHDLRTPLAGILGSASTLREQGEQLKPAQREALLQNLENLARDMTLMADNTLQWVRLGESPHLGLQWESLEELLGLAVAHARQRWSRPGIELRLGRDLPPVRVEARLFMQVLANLLDNAARHGGTAAGRIVVQAGRCRFGVFVAVRDRGPGLPPGPPQALFEPFRQGQARSDTLAKGSGLGLSLCQTIVAAHGGRIEARNAPAEDGAGAEFYIELPVPEPSSAEPMALGAVSSPVVAAEARAGG